MWIAIGLISCALASCSKNSDQSAGGGGYQSALETRLKEMSTTELSQLWIRLLNEQRDAEADGVQDALIERGDENAIGERAHRNYLNTMRGNYDLETKRTRLRECIAMIKSIRGPHDPRVDADSLRRYETALGRLEARPSGAIPPTSK
jgi:hypothetical protein